MTNPVLFLIPILLILPALYFLFFRRSKGGSGKPRTDATEPPELRGSEQAKHRQPK